MVQSSTVLIPTLINGQGLISTSNLTATHLVKLFILDRTEESSLFFLYRKELLFYFSNWFQYKGWFFNLPQKKTT